MTQKCSPILKLSVPNGTWTSLAHSCHQRQIPMAKDTLGSGSASGEFNVLVALIITWADNIRRLCPGLHVANQTIFIDLCFLLWAFDIKNPLDLNGSPIVSSADAYMGTGVN